MKQKDIQQAIQEARTLKKLMKCQQIISYVDIFENKTHLCTVTELMDMSLKEFMDLNGPLDEK